MRTIFLGDYEVVQVTGLGITINLGKQVHITIHTGDFPHKVVLGQKLPLFTKVPYAKPIQSPV